VKPVPLTRGALRRSPRELRPERRYLTGGSSMIVPQLVNSRLVSTRKFDALV
jgi:hypothetical protein